MEHILANIVGVVMPILRDFLPLAGGFLFLMAGADIGAFRIFMACCTKWYDSRYGHRDSSRLARI